MAIFLLLGKNKFCVRGTSRLCDPVRERASTTGRLPAGAADRLRRRCLHRAVIVNNITADISAVNLSASSAAVRYVRRILNYMFTMDVLPYMLLLLFMLFDASSELLFNMLVAAVVMSNILELIMNLLPNFQQSKNLIIGKFV